MVADHAPIVTTETLKRYDKNGYSVVYKIFCAFAMQHNAIFRTPYWSENNSAINGNFIWILITSKETPSGKKCAEQA